MKAFKTREEWLLTLVETMRPWFADRKWKLPAKIRISPSWSSTRPRKVRGECWHPVASADGFFNVTVGLNESDSYEVAGIVVHELAHAATNVTGHKGAFVQCLRDVDILGKPKHANTLGLTLEPEIKKFVKKYGKYPHGAIDFTTKKKQGTRMIKLVCPECTYTVRTTKKWIDTGIPICGICSEDFVMEETEE